MEDEEEEAEVEEVVVEAEAELLWHPQQLREDSKVHLLMLVCLVRHYLTRVLHTHLYHDNIACLGRYRLCLLVMCLV